MLERHTENPWKIFTKTTQQDFLGIRFSTNKVLQQLKISSPPSSCCTVTWMQNQKKPSFWRGTKFFGFVHGYNNSVWMRQGCVSQKVPYWHHLLITILICNKNGWKEGKGENIWVFAVKIWYPQQISVPRILAKIFRIGIQHILKRKRMVWQLKLEGMEIKWKLIWRQN